MLRIFIIQHGTLADGDDEDPLMDLDDDFGTKVE